jgi:hypothetical protein
MLVFEVETALAFFDLVLIVDYFENARTQLGSDLTEHAVCLE